MPKLLRKGRKGERIIYVQPRRRGFYGTYFGGIEVYETALR